MNYILYISFGDEYINQCKFSILTLLKAYNGNRNLDFKIHVYTDRTDKFKDLENAIGLKTEYISIDSLRLKNLYRFKMELINRFFKSHSGKLIFIDTDIIFLKKIDRLFYDMDTRTVYMHKKEGHLRSKKWAEYHIDFVNKAFKLNCGSTVLLDKKSPMWNAGVIGLSSSNVQLVEKSLELYDKLNEIKKVRINEQLAQSIIYNTAKLLPVSKYIFHYWPSDYKAAMNKHINELFSNNNFSLEELIQKAETGNILRMNIWQQIMFHFKPRNFMHFIKFRLPYRLGLLHK